MPICTVIARNYLPRARVLARSLADVGAERLQVLVLDDPARELSSADEPFDVLRPSDIGLSDDEFLRMAASYSVLELATATKAWLLATLVDQAGTAVYLDPDTAAHAELDGLVEAAAKSPDGIALTPHRLTPMPQDGRTPTENELAVSGVFNLGFIALTAQARPFLEWWQARLHRQCLVAVAQGVFVDQRWIDQVPALWTPTIVLDPGVNVAYWNLDERPLGRDADGRPTAGDAALRLMHWSGFDPDARHLLSTHSGDRPRVLLSGQPVLVELHADYARALREATTAEPGHYHWGATKNGFALDHRSRTLYRGALIESEAGNGDEPPNPFVDGDAFVEWLHTPARYQPAGMSRYLRAVWNERPDLQTVFPDLWAPGGLLEWARGFGARDGSIPPEMIPRARVAASVRPADAAGRALGVNVAGYTAAESGVGEGARLLTAALDAGDIDYAVVPYTETPTRQNDPYVAPATAPDFDVNIVCVNADELPRFAEGAGAALFDGRPTVGMWAWEVPQFPPSMAAAARYVDEIWMGSEFAADAVRAAVDTPVFSFPLPIVAPDAPRTDRAGLGLPDGFLFLFAFSFHSVVERKNPFAAVEAFTQAFAPGEGPILVIKSIHGEDRLPELERLRAAARERPDIVILDAVLDRADQASLMHACDAYVSLHRSEGFGLTVAEAMALGKPVIATAYAGPLEFMSPANSWPIPYRLVPVGPGCAPYPPDAYWAEPNVALAAAAMREVVAHPEAAARRARRAARDIAEFHGPDVRARFVADRLAALRGAGAPEPDDEPSPVAASGIRLFAPASDLGRRAMGRLRTDQRARLRRLLAPVSARRPEAGPAPKNDATPPVATEMLSTNLGPLRLPVDEVVHPWVAGYQSWEDDIAAVVRDVLSPGDTAVDIGAHVGLHSVLMAACVGPLGRVLSVEPNATNLELLRDNLAARWYARSVEVLEGAAWDADTTLALQASNVNSGDHRVAPQPDGPIRGIRLDAVIGAGDVRLVKVDAQGSDHIALAGFEQTLRRCRPVVIIEFSPEDTRSAGFDPSSVAQWYLDLGLGVEVLGHPDAATNPGALIALAESTEEGFVTLVLGRAVLETGDAGGTVSPP